MSKLEQCIGAANAEGRLALAAFLTAGFPKKDLFADVVRQIVPFVDVLEIGVPFSDPMADGVSIQHASHEALRQGVHLGWIFDIVEAETPNVPVVLMSYLNPLLAFGLDELAIKAEAVGVAGFIVPDLPYEESLTLYDTLRQRGIDLIPLVTPATPQDRLGMICARSGGFVYAVTMTGTTGGVVSITPDTADYLDRVRQVAPCPVLAGFGIRKPEHIPPFAGHANGVIVGSAFMDVLDKNQDHASFAAALRDATFVEKEAMT